MKINYKNLTKNISKTILQMTQREDSIRLEEPMCIRGRIEDFKKPIRIKMERLIIKKMVFELQYYNYSFEYCSPIICNNNCACCVCNNNSNYYLLINKKHSRIYMCYCCKQSFETKLKKRKKQNSREVIK